MKCERQEVVTKTTSYTINLTEEEYLLFYKGVGRTSAFSREQAGMSEDQSCFFSHLFNAIPHPN